MLADLNTAIRTPLALVQSVYAQDPTLDGLEKRVEAAFSGLFSDASALAQVRIELQKLAAELYKTNCLLLALLHTYSSPPSPPSRLPRLCLLLARSYASGLWCKTLALAARCTKLSVRVATSSCLARRRKAEIRT